MHWHPDCNGRGKPRRYICNWMLPYVHDLISLLNSASWASVVLIAYSARPGCLEIELVNWEAGFSITYWLLVYLHPDSAHVCPVGAFLGVLAWQSISIPHSRLFKCTNSLLVVHGLWSYSCDGVQGTFTLVQYIDWLLPTLVGIGHEAGWTKWNLWKRVDTPVMPTKLTVYMYYIGILV